MKSVLSIVVVLVVVMFAVQWNWQQNRWPKPIRQFNLMQASYESETLLNPVQVELPQLVAETPNKNKLAPIEVTDVGVDGLLLRFALVIEQEDVEEVAVEANIAIDSNGHEIVLESSLDYFPVVDGVANVSLALKIPSRSGHYSLCFVATPFGYSTNSSVVQTDQVAKTTLHLQTL